MPGANHAVHDKSAAPPAPKWSPSKKDQEILDAINATVDRMRKCTESDPYMLTIPQDVEPRYRHDRAFSRHADEAWLWKTPFRRGEDEHTQYQTFIFYEPSRTMFVQQMNRREEDRALASAPRPTQANAASAGPKKVYSLNSYKKKQAAVASTPEAGAAQSNGTPGKPPAVKGPAERVKTENGDKGSIDAIDKEGNEKVMATPVTKTPADTKRKWEDEHRTKVDVGRRVEARAPMEDTPAAKKPRIGNDVPVEGDTKAHITLPPKPISTQNHLIGREAKLKASDVVPRGSPGLPPRISPSLMPTKLSPLNALGITRDKTEVDSMIKIPPRISSELPASICKALEARKKTSRSAKSNPSTIVKDKDGKLTPIATTSGIDKKKVARKTTKQTSRAGSISPSQSLGEPGTGQEDTTTTSKGVGAEVVERPSLLVRLKYRKSRRVNIDRILKMPPQPAARPVASRSGDDAGPARPDLSGKGVAQKVGPTQKRRARSDDSPPPMSEVDVIRSNVDKPSSSAAAAQRRRQHDATDQAPRTAHQPATPSRHDRSSPILGPPSTHKSHAAGANTARKDFLSATAMKREHSQDSLLAVATPPPFPTPNTNYAHLAAGSGAHSRPPSSHPQNGGNAAAFAASAKTPKQQAWDAECSRLSALGRELKHAATAHATTFSTTSSSTEQKLAAIRSLESMLSYFLAFTAADHAALAADPRQAPPAKHWMTLRGFYPWVKKQTAPFPLLTGLACALGAVFSAHVLDLYATYPSLSTSSSAGGADKGTAAEKGAAGSFTLATALDLHSILQAALRDSEAKLDVDTLISTFPKTWDLRQRSGSTAPDPDPQPGKFSGPFRLPISSAQSPLRAARAGFQLLGEWAERNRLGPGEKGGWEMRLKLRE
jgi:hypothetical protein